jgi:anti-sigma factor RsiW
MKRKIGACDPVLLDRFFDGETSADEGMRIEAHLAGCTRCRSYLEANRAIAGMMRGMVNQGLASAEMADLEERLVTRLERRRPGLLRPSRLVPLAAALGMLLWVFTTFLGPTPPNGPSAIVTSFQGDYTSVMIVETPDTRNTIIWFDETS